MTETELDPVVERPRRGAALVSTIVNGAGALVSVGLVIGIGVWGYGLFMRDVTGVPVVRAMAGPMRTVPDDPGGQITEFAGLAVNAVPAGGGVPPLPEAVRLAPASGGLAPEDQPRPLLVRASATPDGGGPLHMTGSGADAPVRHDTDAAVMAALAAALGVAPPEAAPAQEDAGDVRTAALSAPAPDAAAPPPAADGAPAAAGGIAAPAPLRPGVAPSAGEAPGPAAAADAAVPGVLPASVPGVSRSPRPPVRPAQALAQAMGARMAAAAAAPQDGATGAPAPDPAVDRDPASIAAGTRLVQFGAYASVEDARAVWARLSERFADHMTGLERVVQQGEGGGRVFYRLRAVGFEDDAAARRLCAVLTAANTDCVPTVMR